MTLKGHKVSFSEVFLLQRVKCMQEELYLGQENVSYLERCP